MAVNAYYSQFEPAAAAPAEEPVAEAPAEEAAAETPLSAEPAAPESAETAEPAEALETQEDERHSGRIEDAGLPTHNSVEGAGSESPEPASGGAEEQGE